MGNSLIRILDWTLIPFSTFRQVRATMQNMESVSLEQKVNYYTICGVLEMGKLMALGYLTYETCKLVQ